MRISIRKASTLFTHRSLLMRRPVILSMLGHLGLGANDFFQSFSSRSFSSSYSNVNGVEHSESASEESYSEKDSNGLNRNGSGRLIAKDGIQVFEETRNCDGGKCIGSVDSGKHRFARDKLRNRGKSQM